MQLNVIGPIGVTLGRSEEILLKDYMQLSFNLKMVRKLSNKESVVTLDVRCITRAQVIEFYRLEFE